MLGNGAALLFREIVDEPLHLVRLLLDGNAEKCHEAVLYDGAVVVDAAARGIAVLGAQMDRDVVYLVRESPGVERADNADHKLTAKECGSVKHVRRSLP